MFNRIRLLKQKFNFEPKVIYDIGAHQGSWTAQCQQVYPQAKYYLFEANLNKKKVIPDAIFEVLSDTDYKEIVYYKTKTPCDTGNSIYRENTKYFDDENSIKEERTTRTVDSLAEERKLPMPDFVKLDTQGSELNILKGAVKTFKNVQVIMLEISLHEYNEDVPKLDSVVAFMRKYGFIMFDIVDLHYVDDVLIQIDAMFCPKDSDFIVKKFHNI